ARPGRAASRGCYGGPWARRGSRTQREAASKAKEGRKVPFARARAAAPAGPLSRSRRARRASPRPGCHSGSRARQAGGATARCDGSGVWRADRRAGTPWRAGVGPCRGRRGVVQPSAPPGRRRDTCERRDPMRRLLRALTAALLLGLVAGVPALAAATSTDTLAGVEVFPGVIGGQVRHGPTFVGRAPGDLPGGWLVAVNYTPPEPGPDGTD